MKRLFILLFTALSLTLLGCSAEKESIRIISYNIRLSGVNDGENSWQYRREATINMIAEEHPTLFGLQEATPEQMAFLIANLPQYDYIGVGREDGDKNGEHMAIFYLRDEVELLDGGTFWLSETPDTPSIGWDAAYKRTCTWTKLRMRSSGKEFAYLNTHLDHIGKEAQREGLALIVERAHEIVPEGMPAFVTADFNTDTTDPIFEPLKADMMDAREVAPITDPRTTFNGWGTADTRLDHIFFRGAEAQQFSVLRDKDYGAPYISDHYPVMFDATF